MNDVQKKRLEDCTDMHRGLLGRVYSGNRSMRDAIDAFCLQCVGYHMDDVRNCTAIGCPLWQLRPYQVDPPKREVSEKMRLAREKNAERLRNLSQRAIKTLTETP